MVLPPDPVVALASSMHAAPGIFALLIGSGISRAAQVPTGWDVVVALARRVALLEGAEEPDDPLAWYAARFGDAPDYSALVAQLAPTPAERRNLLEGFFEPTPDEREQGVKAPTRAHRAIADLVAGGYVRVIVTTNFDRLLEVALVEAGVQPIVITSPQAATGAIPLAHSRCTIIKVHGDYLDPDLKNTAEELSSYDPAIDALLDQVFDEYGLVVCGWSGEWDQALRNALLRASSRRYGTYWTHRGPLGERAGQLLAHHQAVDVPIAGADEFFESLAAKVTALAEAMDQRPATTALAVAELKRYLPNPEYRIRLHDLLSGEVNRVLDQTNFSSENPYPSADTLAQRLQGYERPMATLLALVANAGYFADRPDHDELLVGVVRRLATRPTGQGHYTLWTHMPQYPILLALYGLGLGCLAARRPNALVKALASIRVNEAGTELPLPMVTHNSRVLEPDAMKKLPGFQQRLTPVSEYLHQQLRKPTHSILPADDEYDEVFDQLEYLLGVVGAHVYGDGHGPPGRFAWRRQYFMRANPDDAVVTHREQLLSAGLFDGSAEALDTALAAYDQRMASRLLTG